MSIYVFTKKEAALKKAFPKNAEFFSEIPLKHKSKEGSIAYIDISGITPANLKTALAQFKKICKDGSWGVIDPKGSIKDPAALFFEGASDFLGPDFFKTSKTIDPKRLKTASQWRSVLAGISITAKTESKSSKVPAGLPKTGIKLPPAATFPGWKNMKTGMSMPFYLLYCSLQGNTALDHRLGDKAYSLLHQRFLAYLGQTFQDIEGIVWMDSGKDCIILLPPKIKNAEAAVMTCIRILISAPLIAIEALGLTIPVNFIFALHYGQINYSPPGKTGTIVSDAVNYAFHLGPKKAEAGRLTISSEIPDHTVPQALEDSFVSAGEYEGRKIWHTKKFSYIKPWL